MVGVREEGAASRTSEGWNRVAGVGHEARILPQRETNRNQKKRSNLLYIFFPDLSWKQHAKTLQRE